LALFLGLYKSLKYKQPPKDKIKVVTSKIKNVFKYVGVEGMRAKRNLPNAMLKVKKASSEKA
jgi:hypothetical protein